MCSSDLFPSHDRFAGWDGFVILVNDGDGTFSEGNHYASTDECGSIKLADFNGDTHLDVALGNKDK